MATLQVHQVVLPGEVLATLLPACPLSGWITWPTMQGSSTRTTSRAWQPTCLEHSEEPTCQTCILGPLEVAILQSLLVALGSPLLPSSLSLLMECIHLQEETHLLGCPHTQHTQGPRCQASLCHPLGSSPQEPILDSLQ